MKPLHFYLTSLLGFVGLLLGIALVAIDQSNERLQTASLAQQEEINRGAVERQTFQNLLHDLAPLAAQDESIRAILMRNGFRISTPSSPAQ